MHRISLNITLLLLPILAATAPSDNITSTDIGLDLGLTVTAPTTLSSATTAFEVSTSTSPTSTDPALTLSTTTESTSTIASSTVLASPDTTIGVPTSPVSISTSPSSSTPTAPIPLNNTGGLIGCQVFGCAPLHLCYADGKCHGGLCPCPQGYHCSEQNICIPDPLPGLDSPCLPGYRWDSSRGLCRNSTDSNDCHLVGCDDGYECQNDGSCRPPGGFLQCGSGQVWDRATRTCKTLLAAPPIRKYKQQDISPLEFGSGEAWDRVTETRRHIFASPPLLKRVWREPPLDPYNAPTPPLQCGSGQRWDRKTNTCRTLISCCSSKRDSHRRLRRSSEDLEFVDRDYIRIHI